MMNLSSFESEQAVIGAILLNPDCLLSIRAELSSDDFSGQKNKLLYETLLTITDNGDPIEPLVITTELEKAGNLKKAGGSEYMGNIIEAVHTSGGYRYHVKQIKEARLRQTLLNLLGSCTDKLKGKSNSIPEVLSDIKTSLMSLDDNRSKKIIRLNKALPGVVDGIEARSKGQGSKGIPTGFIDIDRYTGGLQPGELILIAGRPGMGKSILAKDSAEASGVKVLYFTLEMSTSELIKRQLAGKGDISFEAIRTGRIGQSEWSALIEAANILSNIPIIYVDKASLTIDQLVSISESMKIKEDIGLVVIDYLQLIRPTSKLDIREREVSDISRKLKGLARNLEIPVICLAQLNRSCETRPNKRPRLSDLRESGSLEQDADIVCFIYRDHVYNETASIHSAEFIIAKGRNIRTGMIPLYFDGQHQTFRNATRE